MRVLREEGKFERERIREREKERERERAGLCIHPLSRAWLTSALCVYALV